MKTIILFGKGPSVSKCTKEIVEKTPEGIILDKLQLKKYCCRRHMLTHVDLE